MGLSRVFSTARRVPLVCDSAGIRQPVLLPVQCCFVEHRNQRLHTRWAVPYCASHTDDLFQSDKSHAGVLCREEFPRGGVAPLPPGGVGNGFACFPEASVRGPQTRARLSCSTL